MNMDTLLAAAYSQWSEEYYCASWMSGDEAARDFVRWLGAERELADYEAVTIARVRGLLGLPGTGAVRSPENAPSREDGAAPVSPDRPERPERATPPWHASHQRT